ncbi:MAG TPA: ribonuclease P protein subunit [Thermoplasmata archaeon]|nr:ribonuclease P protein subunit [Thermoplasmata archaeon]
MGASNIDPAFQGEILGATVEIHRAPGFAQLPLRGTLVDETLQTFVVRSLDGARSWRVPKTGLEGTILLVDKQLHLNGDELRMRPEDRTKRLAWRGRRRHP